jgi:hypothetical protein
LGIAQDPRWKFISSSRSLTRRTRVTIVEEGIIDLPYGEGRHAPSRIDAGRPADQRAPS